MTSTAYESNRSSRRFRRGRARLRGFAPDGSEIFITRGDNFEIRGGNADTHEEMLSAAKKLVQLVSMKGYDLAHLTRKEYKEIESMLREMQHGDDIDDDPSHSG